MIQWFNKQMSKKRKGFTLIELIVVIAILGILLALAIPRFTGSLNSAKTRTNEANLRTIDAAVALYVAETNALMADMDDISVLVPNYLDAVPDNPLTETVQAGYIITDGVASASE